MNVTNNQGSLLFIDQLDNKTFKKTYSNWSHAYEQTKLGKLWGYVDLSESFTQSTTDKFSSLSPSNETLLNSNVNLYLDTTSQQIAYVVKAKLLEAYQNFLKKFSPSLPIPLPESFFESPVVVSLIKTNRINLKIVYLKLSYLKF
jgi:hypothetical protein